MNPPDPVRGIPLPPAPMLTSSSPTQSAEAAAEADFKPAHTPQQNRAKAMSLPDGSLPTAGELGEQGVPEEAHVIC